MVQYLYARDIRNQEELNLDRFLGSFDSSEELQSFGRNLAKSIAENQEEIDQLIRDKSEDWDLERMSVVDRNILRLGIAEMRFLEETPRTVVINECVELAKRLGTEDSRKFVNAILDRIPVREDNN